MVPLLIIGIFLALFSAAYFFFKRPRQLGDIIIFIFMIFLALPMLNDLVIMRVVDIPVPDFILMIRAYPFVYGPLLYLYTRAEISEKPRLKRIDLLHFIPFIVFAVLINIFSTQGGRPVDHRPPAGQHPGINAPFENGHPLPGRRMGPRAVTEHGLRPGPHGDLPPGNRPHQIPGERIPEKHGSGDDDRNMRPRHPGSIHPSHMPPAGQEHKPDLMQQINAICILLSIALYSTVILLLLYRHKKKIADYFSYESMNINLSWLRWITLFFFISYVYVFLISRIMPEFYRHPFLNPELSHSFGQTFFIFILSFFSLKQPVIFTVPGEHQGDAGPEADDKKYKRSGLKEDDAQKFLQSLKEYMENEKPYLDGDLTIMDVSEKLDIPRHHLTQVINESLHKNFYAYINEFRLKEAMEMMKDESCKEYTILRIAYDSGFNSKSAFNAIFKKHTSMTPSQFREQHVSGH